MRLPCGDNVNNPDKFPEGYIITLSSKEKEKVVEIFHHLNKLKFSPVLPQLDVGNAYVALKASLYICLYSLIFLQAWTHVFNSVIFIFLISKIFEIFC